MPICKELLIAFIGIGYFGRNGIVQEKGRVGLTKDNTGDKAAQN